MHTLEMRCWHHLTLKSFVSTSPSVSCSWVVRQYLEAFSCKISFSDNLVTDRLEPLSDGLSIVLRGTSFSAWWSTHRSAPVDWERRYRAFATAVELCNNKLNFDMLNVRKFLRKLSMTSHVKTYPSSPRSIAGHVGIRFCGDERFFASLANILVWFA